MSLGVQTTGILQLIVLLMAAIFAIAGIVNIIGPQPMRRAYVTWGYPSWFHRVSGALDVAAAALMAIPQTRIGGLALALAISLAACLTLILHREWRKTPPSVLIAAALGFLIIAIR